VFRPGGGASRLTWRKLGVRLRNLPPESRFKTALRNATPEGELKRRSEAADPAQGQWSHEEMLLALIVDVLREVRYVLLKANGSKNAKQPEPLPRPGVKSKKRKRQPLSLDQAEFLYRWINGPDAE
jgi:hypothetical protein